MGLSKKLDGDISTHKLPYLFACLFVVFSIHEFSSPLSMVFSFKWWRGFFLRERPYQLEKICPFQVPYLPQQGLQILVSFLQFFISNNSLLLLSQESEQTLMLLNSFLEDFSLGGSSGLFFFFYPLIFSFLTLFSAPFCFTSMHTIRETLGTYLNTTFHFTFSFYF